MQGVVPEGDAQAGVVGASRTDPFIDGRITVGHCLQAVAGEKDLMVGIALSGGAQPSLSRLDIGRSEEHTSALQSLMRISYAVFCLKNKKLTIIHEAHLLHW